VTRRLALPLALACLVSSGCAQYDIGRLSSDATAGRNNGTAGSAAARQYLTEELQPLGSVQTQAFSGGTNVVATIPGTDLADEYVVVGAHYDHLGSSCQSKKSGDTICNGATDNAAGVAAALAIARSIGAKHTRRSVVIGLWDGEEDGLVGSRWYVDHPLVPLADTVGYVNFDIQGANLSPSLRDKSFAIGSESGGAGLQQIVRDAIDPSTLQTEPLSTIFGQGRSDHVSFLARQIPTVFFSDATGPCYHTNADEMPIVDFDKLNRETAIALQVTRSLANSSSPPAFVSGTPLATYSDAEALQRTVDLLWQDRDRFSAADQATISDARDDLAAIVADGEGAFGDDDVGTLLSDAATVVNSILVKGPCDGFLAGTG
jgi:Zn-dependent M28 family amino/carboxypeptidase